MEDLGPKMNNTRRGTPTPLSPTEGEQDTSLCRSKKLEQERQEDEKRKREQEEAKK